MILGVILSVVLVIVIIVIACTCKRQEKFGVLPALKPEIIVYCKAQCQDIADAFGEDQEHRACVDTCLIDYQTRNVPAAGIQSPRLIFDHKRKLGLI